MNQSFNQSVYLLPNHQSSTRSTHPSRPEFPPALRSASSMARCHSEATVAQDLIPSCRDRMPRIFGVHGPGARLQLRVPWAMSFFLFFHARNPALAFAFAGKAARWPCWKMKLLAMAFRLGVTVFEEEPTLAPRAAVRGRYVFSGGQASAARHD